MSKILVIISASNRFGGTLPKLKMLIENSEHDYVVYFPLYKKDSQQYLNNKEWFSDSGKIKVYEGFYGANILKHTAAVLKILAREKIRIVHTYFNLDNLIGAVCKIINPKIILLRSIVGYEHNQYSKKDKILLRFCFRKVDFFIYISNYIKELYENMFPVIIHTKHQIIYNAPTNINERTINFSDRTTMVCTSGLAPRKNLTVLIDALNILKQKYNKEYKLYILGEGKSRGELQEKIDNYGLTKNVFLEGYKTDVPDYLAKCCLYLHSADTEGFGIAVIEAMYMGCPAIVSNAGALPELIENNVSGLIVDAYAPEKWADAINDLLDDRKRLEEMSLAAKERVQKLFPKNQFVGQHDKLYNSLI